MCANDKDVILVYGVSLHESVNLVCHVVANPAQVSFNWRFQGNSDLSSFNQINDTRFVFILDCNVHRILVKTSN